MRLITLFLLCACSTTKTISDSGEPDSEQSADEGGTEEGGTEEGGTEEGGTEEGGTEEGGTEEGGTEEGGTEEGGTEEGGSEEGGTEEGGTEEGGTEEGGTAGGDPPPPSPRRIVAYFTEWGVYGRDYTVEDIPADQITHINYAFANLSADGECLVHDDWAALDLDGGNFAKLRMLRDTHPDLKVLISIGGWTLSTHFSSVASTAEGRTAMVNSCIDFMVTHGFDGIDVDWEYPVGGGLSTGTAADTENYTLLMAEFRERLDALDEVYLLSIAAPAGPSTIEHMDLPGLEPSLDWFNLMSYDLHGGWESTTNFNAPLYPSSTSPSEDEAGLNVDAAVQTYLDAGIPSDKLVMGLPFYGRGWSGVPATDSGLYQPATGLAPGTWEAGVYDYSDVVSLMADPVWIGAFHSETMVPWVYNPTEGVFISYDNPTSFGHKLDYVDEHELGGVMFWELSGDTDDHALVDLLHERLGD